MAIIAVIIGITLFTYSIISYIRTARYSLNSLVRIILLLAVFGIILLRADSLQEFKEIFISTLVTLGSAGYYALFMVISVVLTFGLIWFWNRLSSGRFKITSEKNVGIAIILSAPAALISLYIVSVLAQSSGADIFYTEIIYVKGILGLIFLALVYGIYQQVQAKESNAMD